MLLLGRSGWELEHQRLLFPLRVPYLQGSRKVTETALPGVGVDCASRQAYNVCVIMPPCER
jgi:hypothetical protein